MRMEKRSSNTAKELKAWMATRSSSTPQGTCPCFSLWRRSLERVERRWLYGMQTQRAKSGASLTCASSQSHCRPRKDIVESNITCTSTYREARGTVSQLGMSEAEGTRES